MTPLQRTRAACVVLILSLGALGAWSLGQLRANRQAAAAAAADLAVCQDAATNINNLRRKPSLAGSEEMQLTELARLIEQAARTAQMSMDSLVRIWPEQARRVADTVYKEKPTHVLLRGVTLRQLIAFLHTLTDGDSGLRVKHIRLVTPRGDDAGSRWTAEATVTYLIYAPRTEAGGRLTGLVR